jgi:hypothetical protein
MLLDPAQGDAFDTTYKWTLVQEAVRPEDGATVRRWAKSTYDVAKQLQHTHDRYEVARGVEVIDVEYQTRSDATCWYTRQQATDLFRLAGFDHVHAVTAFTNDPATAGTIFSVFGTRPVASQQNIPRDARGDREPCHNSGRLRRRSGHLLVGRRWVDAGTLHSCWCERATRVGQGCTSASVSRSLPPPWTSSAMKPWRSRLLT